MNLIDPFQFRDMFRSVRSVAVVGNAPCILDWKNGEAIDSHDMVVRFNRATVLGLEERIGSRTDVLVVNAANSLDKAPPPAELTQPRCLVCFVSPQGSRTTDVEPFRDWVGQCPVLLTFGPDLIGFAAAHRTKPLTSGTYALFTLLRLFEIEQLFVTGFTMFGAVPGGAEKYYADPNLAPGYAHDLDQETHLFAGILQRFAGQLTVTEEIRELLRREGVELAPVSAENAQGPSQHRTLKQRVVEGLAWRMLNAGMALRRSADTR